MPSNASVIPLLNARTPFVLFKFVVSFWQPTYSHFEVLGNTVATAAVELVVCARAIDASRDAIRRKARVDIREIAIVCSVLAEERREEGGGGGEGGVEARGGGGWNGIFVRVLDGKGISGSFLLWAQGRARLGFSLGSLRHV